MGLELSISTDFSTPESCDFLSSDETIFTEPRTAYREELEQSGYITTGRTHLLQAQPGTPNIEVLIAEQETYVVLNGATVLEQVNLLVPITYELKVSLIAKLYVGSNLSPAESAAAETAFDSFDGTMDPEDFAAQKEVELGIQASNYRVTVLPRYEKISVTRNEHFRDEAITRIVGGETLTVERLTSSLICPFTPESIPAVKQYEVANPEDEGPIDEIGSQIGAEVGHCDVFTTKKRRVTTLFQYPEFRLAAYYARIKIGCSYIVIKLWKLETRTTKKALWAIIVVGFDGGEILAEVVECLEYAAAASFVVGISTAQIHLAIAAFKAVFTRCLEVKVAVALPCLVPDLLILTEKGSWS